MAMPTSQTTFSKKAAAQAISPSSALCELRVDLKTG